MYLIETHLHTKEVSKCAHLYAAETAELYHKAGYHAIVVTDHYNQDTWDYLDINAQAESNVMPRFTAGYHALKESAGQYGIKVILGAELRFNENKNDYLLYNFPEEMLARPREVMAMGAAAFSKLAREAGALMIQAHPFRRGCVPVDPMLIDGAEIYNANPRHLAHAHNELAQAIARREGKGFIRTAGSDSHRTEDTARSGLRSPILPADAASFAALLRSGEYETIILPEA